MNANIFPLRHIPSHRYRQFMVSQWRYTVQFWDIKSHINTKSLWTGCIPQADYAQELVLVWVSASDVAGSSPRLFPPQHFPS